MMEITVTERIAMDQLSLSEDAALAHSEAFASATPMDLVARPGVPFCRLRRAASSRRFSDDQGMEVSSLAFRLSLLMLGALVALAGCESKGPAEKAGESIDKGIQNAKNAINPPGPAEKAGRNLDKALKP